VRQQLSFIIKDKDNFRYLGQFGSWGNAKDAQQFETLAEAKKRRDEFGTSGLKIVDLNQPVLKAFNEIVVTYFTGRGWDFVREFKLTPSEIAVLAVVIHNPDKTEKELEDKLGLSKTGIEYHLRNICDKAGIPTGANRRAALISKVYDPHRLPIQAYIRSRSRVIPSKSIK
jgi:DNA-binding CsgD family transcriptional regulator